MKLFIRLLLWPFVLMFFLIFNIAGVIAWAFGESVLDETAKEIYHDFLMAVLEPFIIIIKLMKGKD